MRKLNPRYIAYAIAHGRDAEAQLERDKATYPGGCMCGFLVWMNCRKRDYVRSNAANTNASGTIVAQAHFTAFLLQSAAHARLNHERAKP